MPKVTRGKIEQPLSILLYGIEKIGKTTFASNAPNPVFMDIEKGSGNLNVARTEYPNTFNDAIRIVEEVATDQEYKEFKTFIIDSLDWLEDLCFKQVIAKHSKMVESISEIDWGKGYPVAFSQWKELVKALERVRESGKNIILLAHSSLKVKDDPMAPAPYDRFSLKLYEGSSKTKANSTCDLFKEFVDCFLFATYEMYPNKDAPNRPYGDGTRVLYTEWRPSHDAGNRLGLPYKLPFDWETFYAEASPKKGEQEAKVKAQIEEMILQLKDEEKKKAASEALPKKKSLAELNSMRTKLEALIG